MNIKDGFETTFTITCKEECKRWEFDMENDNMKEHWTGIFSFHDTLTTELAFELWKTGYHEAKLLAVLLFDKKQISYKDIEQLMSNVCSWDLCNHL